MNTNKTEFMYFKQDDAIFWLNGKPLKLIDQFKFLGSNISSTQSNVNIHIGKLVGWLGFMAYQPL